MSEMPAASASPGAVVDWQRHLEPLGSRALVVTPRGSLSYREILAEAIELGEAFGRHGISGVTPAFVIHATNDVAARLVAFLACQIAGCAYVPRPAVASGEVADVVGGIADKQLPPGQCLWLLGGRRGWRGWHWQGRSLVRVEPEQESSGNSDGLASGTSWQGGWPALVVFTSGSTGQAKGVAHSQASLMAATSGFQRFFGIDASYSKVFVVLPTHHIAGFMVLFRALVFGQSLVCFPESHWLDAAATAPAYDLVSMVPTQLFSALNHPAALKRLRMSRLVLLGGGAPSRTLLVAASEKISNISVSYGSSEAAATMMATAVGQPLGPLVPLPHSQFIRRDEHLLLASPALFSGYFIGGLFEPCPLSEGYWDTGDRGERDGEGWRLLERADGVIKLAGTKIPLRDLRERLQRWWGSAVEVVVDSRADDVWGEVPIIKLVSAAELPLQTIRLQDFYPQIPKRFPPCVVVWQPIPELSSGIK